MRALKRKGAIRPAFWAGVFLIPALFLLTGCSLNVTANQDTITHNSSVVVCIDSEFSSYTEVLTRVLPTHQAGRYPNHPFTYLREGVVVEVFDTQAVSALTTENATYWYPHYLATVVIAVDLDATDATIYTWSDLLKIDEHVAFYPEQGLSNAAFLAAISYGLEGERFTLRGASNLLAMLQEQDRLSTNSLEPPLLICFDYQAAELVSEGRNLKIVVPSEGTLSFERGLLSQYKLSFAGDVDELLLDAGFRLSDGRSDAALYPTAQDYSSAAQITDYDHFNTTILDESRVIRRDVLHTRIYSSVDGREHQYWVLGSILLIVLWVAFILYRTAQKAMRRAVFCIGLILLGWIIARLISYQLDNATIFSSTFWYSYYIFQLALPLAILWLAQSVDKPDDNTAIPLWLRVIAAINALLVIAVLTNNVHNLVYVFDYTNPRWFSEYTYGPLFYVVQTGCYLPLAAGIILLFYKGRQGLKKRGILFIGALILLLLAYAIGYITRVPLAWDSDYTMVVSLFTLLFLETSLRSGIIPANSRYLTLFKHSRLAIRIFDKSNRVALASAVAVNVDEATRLHALASSPTPVYQDENTLLYAAPTLGGYALWQEDVSRLSRLQRELHESVEQLTAAHALLVEEEKIRRAAEEEKEKTLLLLHLEAEIAGALARLDVMVKELTYAPHKREAIALIVLQLAYIKRRCNLFFHEREDLKISTEALTLYLEELAELASYSSIRIVVTREGTGTLSVQQATLLYDFFHQLITWMIEAGTMANTTSEAKDTVKTGNTVEAASAPKVENFSIIAHLSCEEKLVALRLLVSKDIRAFLCEESLNAAFCSESASYQIKDLDDDTLGITLSLKNLGLQERGERLV